jgi:hypothetical protein
MKIVAGQLTKCETTAALHTISKGKPRGLLGILKRSGAQGLIFSSIWSRWEGLKKRGLPVVYVHKFTCIHIV